MKKNRGRGGNAFRTTNPDGGEWSSSRPGRFTPGTHWIKCCDSDVAAKFIYNSCRDLQSNHRQYFTGLAALCYNLNFDKLHQIHNFKL